MSPTVTIPNHFTPRPYQRRFMRYFDKGGKRAVWVVHRRGGKDLTALHQTCKMMHRRKGVYWHVFPTGEQAKKAIWEGFTKDGERIMEQVFPREIRKSPRAFLPSSETVVELKCGSIWRLLGSDKLEVVGSGPVGVTFSEFALSKPKTWDLIRPMLRENDGWAAFITTPRGSNHAKKLYDVARQDPAWFCDLQTLEDTQAYNPEQTLREERESGMPEALIRQEYLCDWTAANVGSVWGDLLEGLEKRGALAEFEHPNDGVFTSWDLGTGDQTAIWFWRVNGEGVDLIDHHEAQGKGMSHYFDVVDSKPYRYVRHWLPHDARQRSWQTGVNVVDQFNERFGSGLVAMTPGQDKASFFDGIQAARWLLQKPVRIHPRCAAGVEALKFYHYEWDEDRKTFGKKPQHDWSSHSADAFRYVAVVARFSELMTRPKAKPAPKPVTVTRSTLDELFASRETDAGGVF